MIHLREKSGQEKSGHPLMGRNLGMGNLETWRNLDTRYLPETWRNLDTRYLPETWTPVIYRKPGHPLFTGNLEKPGHPLFTPLFIPIIYCNSNLGIYRGIVIDGYWRLENQGRRRSSRSMTRSSTWRKAMMLETGDAARRTDPGLWRVGCQMCLTSCKSGQ